MSRPRGSCSCGLRISLSPSGVRSNLLDPVTPPLAVTLPAGASSSDSRRPGRPRARIRRREGERGWAAPPPLTPRKGDGTQYAAYAAYDARLPPERRRRRPLASQRTSRAQPRSSGGRGSGEVSAPAAERGTRRERSRPRLIPRNSRSRPPPLGLEGVGPRRAGRPPAHRPWTKPC